MNKQNDYRVLKLARIILLILPLCLTITGCNSLEKKLAGTWTIDKVYFYEEPAVLNYYSNAFDLKEDYTCELPIGVWSERYSAKEQGRWKVFSRNDTMYLQIVTENTFFNNRFEIRNLRKSQDSITLGHLMKMTLIVDSLRMECTKLL